MRKIHIIGALALALAGCHSAAHGGLGAGGNGDTDGNSDGGNSDGGSSDDHDAGSSPPACSTPVAPDPLLPMREACTFVAGAKADATLGLSDDARRALPIRHVIVVMKENRSFDHLFGGLKALQPDADVADATFVNPDANNVMVAPYHLGNTCVGFDPDHQWDAMHAQVDGGKMDGFVKSAASSTGGDGHFVMGHYEPTDLPFYYFLASTFAIADRYFPAVRSGTFPNRDYLLLGTSDKVQSTQYTVYPDPTLPSIFDELDAAHVTWKVYGDDHPLEETLDDPAHDWSKLHAWYPVQQLLDDLTNNTMPQVAFVDGTENVQDEHPTADLQVGEAWTKKIYDAARTSPTWSSTAIFLTYDEAGGFADHVPPSNMACLARPADAAFFERGSRVPLIAISPWARRHYVSHVEKEHTSITRFIEALFALPALTARDANADALLDMFDFDCPPTEVPAAPAAGTNGCGGGSSVTLDKSDFASGEAITVHFTGGPSNPKDWIALYPRNQKPASGSTLWQYCASNTHTAPAAGVASGSITLDATSAGSASSWPLAPGSSWTVYFLVNDGYDAIASVQLDIHN